MKVKHAVSGDEREALGFYHKLIDDMRGTGLLRWEKGVYPTLADLQDAVRTRSLHLGYEDQRIAGAFILSQGQTKEYEQVPWTRDVPSDKVAVLHLLATDRELQGQGIGTRLLQEAVHVAAERGDEVIRLDTLTYNIPGQKLYEKFGFVCSGDVEIYYPTTGKIPFRMYEYFIQSTTGG